MKSGILIKITNDLGALFVGVTYGCDRAFILSRYNGTPTDCRFIDLRRVSEYERLPTGYKLVLEQE